MVMNAYLLLTFCLEREKNFPNAATKAHIMDCFLCILFLFTLGMQSL